MYTRHFDGIDNSMVITDRPTARRYEFFSTAPHAELKVIGEPGHEYFGTYNMTGLGLVTWVDRHDGLQRIAAGTPENVNKLRKAGYEKNGGLNRPFDHGGALAGSRDPITGVIEVHSEWHKTVKPMMEEGTHGQERARAAHLEALSANVDEAIRLGQDTVQVPGGLSHDRIPVSDALRVVRPPAR